MTPEVREPGSSRLPALWLAKSQLCFQANGITAIGHFPPAAAITSTIRVGNPRAFQQIRKLPNLSLGNTGPRIRVRAGKYQALLQGVLDEEFRNDLVMTDHEHLEEQTRKDLWRHMKAAHVFAGPSWPDDQVCWGRRLCAATDGKSLYLGRIHGRLPYTGAASARDVRNLCGLWGGREIERLALGKGSLLAKNSALATELRLREDGMPRVISEMAANLGASPRAPLFSCARDGLMEAISTLMVLDVEYDRIQIATESGHLTIRTIDPGSNNGSLDLEGEVATSGVWTFSGRRLLQALKTLSGPLVHAMKSDALGIPHNLFIDPEAQAWIIVGGMNV